MFMYVYPINGRCKNFSLPRQRSRVWNRSRLCVCLWVYGGTLVHHFNGIRGPCAPSGAICTTKMQCAPWCTRETIFFEKSKTHIVFLQFLPMGQYGLCFGYSSSCPLPLCSHKEQVTFSGPFLGVPSHLDYTRNRRDQNQCDHHTDCQG